MQNDLALNTCIRNDFSPLFQCDNFVFREKINFTDVIYPGFLKKYIIFYEK